MTSKFVLFATFLLISLKVGAVTEVWEAEINPPWVSQNGSTEFTVGTGYTLWFILELDRGG